MTKHNNITNIDLTIKEIYDEYTKFSIMHLWESRNDDCQNIETLTYDLKRDITGLIKPKLQRDAIRRLFAEGYTMMMLPSIKFDWIEDASNNNRDFTISIYNENAKLILILTTDEVSW
jgi:hypothetical protein